MRLIDADDLIKAFEALDLMNGQYAESFSNIADCIFQRKVVMNDEPISTPGQCVGINERPKSCCVLLRYGFGLTKPS